MCDCNCIDMSDLRSALADFRYNMIDHIVENMRVDLVVNPFASPNTTSIQVEIHIDNRTISSNEIRIQDTIIFEVSNDYE